MNCAKNDKKGFGARCDKCHFVYICSVSAMLILTKICDIFLLLNNMYKILFFLS